MILSLEELTKRLQSSADPNDTLPSDALWITFAPEEERHVKSADYRTPDNNVLVRVYLDKDEALVGIEIFP
jgi:hypothetical protein